MLAGTEESRYSNEDSSWTPRTHSQLQCFAVLVGACKLSRPWLLDLASDIIP